MSSAAASYLAMSGTFVDSQFVVDNEKQGDPLAGLLLMVTQVGRVRVLSTLSWMCSVRDLVDF